MTTLTVTNPSVAIDFDDLDLNWFIRNYRFSELGVGVNLTVNGRVYADAAYIDAVQGSEALTLGVGGTGLTTNGVALTGGTITGLLEMDTATEAIRYIVQDFSISATSFQAALNTLNSTDDRALLQSVLLGDDTFSLGNMADRVFGYDGNDTIYGFGGNDYIDGGAGIDWLYGGNDLDTLLGGDGGDYLIGGAGNDTINGGSNVDIAIVSGNRSSYTLTANANGSFTVSGLDGSDTLTNVEYVKFDDQTIRLYPGQGTTVNFATDNPATYMTAIRDFDGNDVGSNTSWKLIGSADVNGDGDVDQVFVNKAAGRFAEVGTAPDGKVYFSDYSWAGETRVVGIYIDPLVQSGQVVAGSDHDSQRRFQNDLQIDNIKAVLGSGDYDHNGLQEVYFSLTDGTAFLHAYMHADGNIQYANYQSQAQVTAYLQANGWASSTYANWFI